MIASIQGKIAAKSRDHVVITTGGIGYKVFAPYSTLEKLSGDEAYLLTVLIVREDHLALYGFATPAEREVFEILLTISGVGPRTALAILSTLTVDNLKNAVLAERPEMIARVPGIGSKTAQKILIELKDKLKLDLGTTAIAGFDDLNSDVLDALVALGYSIVEAQTAIQSLPSNAPPNVEERVRLALQYFA
jgi:Holliday junction DNA helicase RuvA